MATTQRIEAGTFDTARLKRVLTRASGQVLLYGILIPLSFMFVLPLLWMISTSVKVDAQVYHVPPIWFPWPVRPENYPEAMQAQPFHKFFLNTFNYAVLSTLGVLISSSLVAYGFSRIRWRGRDVLFSICIATIMIPFFTTLIPLYIIFSKIGWVNSYLPMIVPTFFGTHAYYIFLLRQFFRGIPEELSDAARIDGANELRILLSIMLPLVKPALAVVALLHIRFAWNDYLQPLIYLRQKDLFPISIGLQTFQGQFVEKLGWSYLMAASTVVIAPIIVLYFFTQRSFIEGVTITGIKG